MRRSGVRFLGMFLACALLAVGAGCNGPTASGTVIGDILIEKPSAEVWDTICNIDPFEGSGVVKRVGGQGGNQCTLGYSEEQVYSAWGQEMKIHIMLVDYDPGKKTVFKFSGDFDGTVTWMTVPEGNNTRLYCIMEAAASLPPGISRDAAKALIQKNVDDILVTVKKNMEK